MLGRYVLADLIRNPRRTLSTMVGVTLGVGLFCAVLFFIDGLSASMTQRAVAPLAIDMQRIVQEQVGGALALRQTIETSVSGQARIELELDNGGDVAANEVTVRSVPPAGFAYIAGSGEVDGTPLVDLDGNPFAEGSAKTGFNLGTVEPGTVRRLTYLVAGEAVHALSNTSIASSYSSRESVTPVSANEQAVIALEDLAHMIAAIDGVAEAHQLSFANLGPDTLAAGRTVARGPAKIFGFDTGYANQDASVQIVDGALSADGVVISAESASALSVWIGDTVTVALPDKSTFDATVDGIADLSQARSLFSSRRGGDLETFVYTPNSIIVSPQLFADTVLPAYERAATTRGERLKNPPVREIDIKLDRNRLAADPATALIETQRIGNAVGAIATRQDFVLDNISNTLGVAAEDASVAKRLFVFLGVPGGLLAAMLAGYAGSVLADAQRREHATLRIRGAGRRHLLRMLALRTGLLTAAGSAIGLLLGYFAAFAILGTDSMSRASTASLARSASIGTVGGFIATGLALYLTGRRSIDREINEDRARHSARPPLWRRAWLDVIATAVVVIGTGIALQQHAFDGAAGSVYFGRAVQLNLILLVLPLAVWISGSLLAARLVTNLLNRAQPKSSSSIGPPLRSLFRLSVSRRPWAIGNGAIAVSMIVALATTLGAFTASYDAAKTVDARFANGSDIRITPSPTSPDTYLASDASTFQVAGIAVTTPVIYGVSNVILRSARTSDPANLAAIEPTTFASTAPLNGNADRAIQLLHDDPTAVLLSNDMAAFLKAAVGDPLFVLLARSTPDQVEVELHIAGLYERLPGFPEGVDAVMNITEHTTQVPSKPPDFFLAATSTRDSDGLDSALSSLQSGPASVGDVRLDSRLTTLARDQSSLAALNIAGLVDLDSTFALGMVVVTIAIFVFGLLLQRRREYITLRAQGLEPRTIRFLITAEAALVAVSGAVTGVVVGAVMGFYFVTVLRPLFVLTPNYAIPVGATAIPVGLALLATILTSLAGSRLVSRLEPTELLRDE
jgi:putative ABC transport system permease protein